MPETYAKPEILPLFPEIKGAIGLEPINSDDGYSAIRPSGAPIGRHDVGSELSKAARALAIQERTMQILQARSDPNEFVRLALHDEVVIDRPIHDSMMTLAKKYSSNIGPWYKPSPPTPPIPDRNPCGELLGCQFFNSRLYISISEMMLYGLKCDPPKRTRSGAWRVGRRRFRTRYLAAKYLSKVSPRTDDRRDTLDAISGLMRDKIICAEEARIMALWDLPSVPKTIKTTKPNPREWRPEILTSTTPGIMWPWSAEPVMRRVNFPKGSELGARLSAAHPTQIVVDDIEL